MSSKKDLSRTHVILHEDHVAHVSSTDFPHQYPDEDLSFNLAQFKKLKIWNCSPTRMEFDMIGVDAAFANAFRRILIAEVPTMAIDTVYINNNTSVVQDEILAQRLGLIPISADPDEFFFKSKSDANTDLNTIVLKLEVECKFKDPKKAKIESDDDLINGKVLSGHLKFIPQGVQIDTFKDRPIKPVFDDILIAKMRPGQAIDAELHLIKGEGRSHAKWSPVATASYRLLPDIIIKEDITGPLADKFVSCFPEGVAEVKVVDGVRKAVVKNPRKCLMSREVLRHPELADKVILARVRDHFIFEIESTGAITPQELFKRAISLMKEKCQIARKALEHL